MELDKLPIAKYNKNRIEEFERLKREEEQRRLRYKRAHEFAVAVVSSLRINNTEDGISAYNSAVNQFLENGEMENE